MDIYELVRNNDEAGIREHAWSTGELDRQTEDGMTPMMLAASLGYDRVVTALKDMGADPDIADRQGRKAVHHAALNGHGLIIVLLIKGGCGG
jgi:ankyrin repeat protein